MGRFNVRSLVFAFVFMILFVAQSNADTTYSYTGNPYNTFPLASSGYSSSNFITATLDLANPLLPNQSYAWGFGGLGTPTATDTLLGFSESDGKTTYTSGGIDFWIATNSSGQIATWFVASCGSTCAPSTGIDLQTSFGNMPNLGNDIGQDVTTLGGDASELTLVAYTFGSPGTWTKSTTGVPEPSTLYLLGLGMLALLSLSLKKAFA